jgi:hypothetical protein
MSLRTETVENLGELNNSTFDLTEKSFSKVEHIAPCNRRFLGRKKSMGIIVETRQFRRISFAG